MQLRTIHPVDCWSTGAHELNWMHTLKTEAAWASMNDAEVQMCSNFKEFQLLKNWDIFLWSANFYAGKLASLYAGMQQCRGEWGSAPIHFLLKQRIFIDRCIAIGTILLSPSSHRMSTRTSGLQYSTAATIQCCNNWRCPCKEGVVWIPSRFFKLVRISAWIGHADSVVWKNIAACVSSSRQKNINKPACKSTPPLSSSWNNIGFRSLKSESYVFNAIPNIGGGGIERGVDFHACVWSLVSPLVEKNWERNQHAKFRQINVWHTWKIKNKSSTFTSLVPRRIQFIGSREQ